MTEHELAAHGAVHYFLAVPRQQQVHPFQEGGLPRRLWHATQALPR
jgi:hypothetical protein